MADCGTNFADLNTNLCVSDCPDGYTENTNYCTPTAFCHSTCQICALKNDPAQCTTCSSTFALAYQSFTTKQTEGTCALTPTNNAQFILTVNKDTIIGSSELKSVTYNTSLTETTADTVLSSFLYTQNVIEFKSLASNFVVFDFDTLPSIHQKLIVRARVFT